MTPVHILLYFTIYKMIKIVGETQVRTILTGQITMDKMLIIVCIIVLKSKNSFLPTKSNVSATLHAYFFILFLNYTTKLLFESYCISFV